MNKVYLFVATGVMFGAASLVTGHAESRVVKDGDGLYRIAQRAGYSDYASPARWNAIANLNGYKSYKAYHLHPGQLVKVREDKIVARNSSKPVMMAYVASDSPQGCNHYQELINSVSAKYGVRASMIRAQLLAESSCNPKATNITGKERSIGIAQINLNAHPDVSYTQAINPVFAIDWQARKMRDLIAIMGSEYDGLRAYNCGTGGAKSKSCGASYANKILNLAK